MDNAEVLQELVWIHEEQISLCIIYGGGYVGFDELILCAIEQGFLKEGNQ